MEGTDKQKYVSRSLFQLMLQEIMPTSIRVTQQLRETRTQREMDESNEKQQQTRLDTQLSGISGDTPGRVDVLQSPLIASDDVTVRIELLGVDVGLRLTEILMLKTNSKIVDILDIMKFVCRDVWKVLYGKQMDNLRTNHRGTFVLIDNKHRLIDNMMSDGGITDTVSKGKHYVWFSCGIIRGILMSFAVFAQVTSEISHFPSVSFNVQTGINN